MRPLGVFRRARMFMTKQPLARTVFITSGLIAASAVLSVAARPVISSGSSSAPTLTKPATSNASDAIKGRIVEAYGNLPLSFERNVGQTDSRVEFLARGNGYTLFLGKGAETILSLRRLDAETDGVDHAVPPAADAADVSQEAVPSAVLKLQFVGSSTVTARGESELPGKVNYLTGTNSAWRTGVSTFGKVRYANVYPGIDVVFYGNQRELEYDFIVSPGADPSRILLEFSGADRLSLNGKGDAKCFGLVVLDETGISVAKIEPRLFPGSKGTDQPWGVAFDSEDRVLVGGASQAISGKWRFAVARYKVK